MSKFKKFLCAICACLLCCLTFLTATSLLFNFPINIFDTESKPQTEFVYECDKCGNITPVKSAKIVELDENKQPIDKSNQQDSEIKVANNQIQASFKKCFQAINSSIDVMEKEIEKKKQEEEEAKRTEEEKKAKEEAEQMKAAAKAANVGSANAAKSSNNSSSGSGEVKLPPKHLWFKGEVHSYIDSHMAGSAPKREGALWDGSDSTTDGSWGYFIGHNPGDFNQVMNLRNDDTVKVCDRNGNSRTYSVISYFNVSNTQLWDDELQGRVCGYGESVILQTCVGDNAHYRIVVAQAV